MRRLRARLGVTGSFAIVVLVAFAVLLVMGWQIRATRHLAVQNRQLAVQGKEAHDGLCALKRDYEQRIEASLKFLRENPKGIPGIPASLIRNTVRNQQATLDALARLRCRPV